MVSLARCSKVIGPAHNVALRLLSFHLSQMATGQSSAAIVTRKIAQTDQEKGSNIKEQILKPRNKRGFSFAKQTGNIMV